MHYTCKAGQEIRVAYDNTDPAQASAWVQIGTAAKRKMQLVRSASGARYSDGELVWWTKGKIGFLMEAEENGKILINDCREYQPQP